MPRVNRTSRNTVRLRASIEIPASLTVSLLDQRQELQLRGRVFSPVPPEEITVRYDGATTFRLRRNGGPANPQNRYSFACNLIRPAGQAGELWPFDITACFRDGSATSSAFRVADQGAASAEVLSGPSFVGTDDDDPLPPIILHLDRATLDRHNRLFLQGWALAVDPVRAIRVLDVPDPLQNVMLAQPRPDVAGLRPDYPNAAECGFAVSMQLPVTNAAATVRLEVETAGDDRLELLVSSALAGTSATPDTILSSVPSLPSPRREIRLFCDLADVSPEGQLTVTGWAICATGIVRITASIDGNDLGEVEFGLPRHDVADEYITIPMARHSGFRLNRLISPDLSERELIIAACNGLGDVREIRVTMRQAEPIAAREPAVSDTSARTEFRLEIDSPAIIDGVVREPVGSHFTVDGWALCRAGIAGIDVTFDDLRLGDVHYGLARQDVANAFPDWPNAVRSGFAFHCPPRLLRDGMHEIKLHLRAVNGDSLTRSFTVEVRKSDECRDGTTTRDRMSRVEADFYRRILERSDPVPAFHVGLLIARQPEAKDLVRTIDSLAAQILQGWELLVIAADADTADQGLEMVLDIAPDLSGRVWVLHDAAPWPHTTTSCDGKLLVGFLTPGDELRPDALAEIAIALALSPNAEVVYADESRISPISNEREPFFKPDYSPDLLLSTNYIGRPCFVTPRLIDASAITPASVLIAGEYDLVLKCTERAAAVLHVPKLLCERSPDAPGTVEQDQQALIETICRRGLDAEIRVGPAPGYWHVRRINPAHGTVSVIIPTRASGGHIKACIRGLRERTANPNIEIICIENIVEPRSHWYDWLTRHADMVLTASESFNWSRFNNIAAARASGDFLLFLNDDVEVDHPDWLDAMLEHAARPEIGVVGARLLYPDRTVQHAGMFLAGFGVGRHAFRLAAESDPGYFGLAHIQREVSAVTGACMLMRREHFVRLGGFDEAHMIVNNDVDFCLRSFEAGLSVLYTPHATLIHHEQATRGGMPDIFDRQRFAHRWSMRFAKGDPFYNPNLSRHHDDFRPNEEPVRTVHGGQRLPAAVEIHRILVVKVDHIGDFMTALPAIRRLKSHFPQAEIHVLASPATTGFAAFEPAITRMIPFEFFHARSALGQKTIGASELDALHRQLAPLQFDLAIDMRKHPETRPLLRASGARFLAGFDYAGQFTWLDLALEWEGDRGLQPKRYHVSDDLLHLVDVVANATSVGPVVSAARLDHPAGWAGSASLFSRPVVCIHPGAGNEMKQWPTEHFVALIDLLADDSQINVLLIGGPEESEIGNHILAAVRQPGTVHSAIGEVSLAALPALLSRCALFVGNDSGPKHVAAAVGIPTVGIHSGTVDPTEWGPLGANAVAIARQMSCSPCYLNRPADCVRDLCCIRQIEPDVVFGVCRRLLLRTRRATAGSVTSTGKEASA